MSTLAADIYQTPRRFPCQGPALCSPSSSTDRLRRSVEDLIFPLALSLLTGLLIASPTSAAAWHGVTVVARLGALFTVVATGYALANPNPNALGPHNFADYTAIGTIEPLRNLIDLSREGRPANCA